MHIPFRTLPALICRGSTALLPGLIRSLLCDHLPVQTVISLYHPKSTASLLRAACLCMPSHTGVHEFPGTNSSSYQVNPHFYHKPSGTVDAPCTSGGQAPAQNLPVLLNQGLSGLLFSLNNAPSPSPPSISLRTCSPPPVKG